MHRGNIFLPYFFTFTKSAVILLERNKKGLNQIEMRPRLINAFLANVFVGDFSGYKMGTMASNGLTTTHTRAAHLEIILLHIRLLSIIKQTRRIIRRWHPRQYIFYGALISCD